MDKGITLVSLVITIVIMLILAGVGISGSLALIEYAKYSAFANEMKQADEAVYLVIMEGQIDRKTTEEILADIGTKISKEDLGKISDNLKYEILYAREGFPASKLPTAEFYYGEELENFSSEESIDSIFMVNSSVAGKEKAYIYDEQSASTYKVESTIIWGVEMHGYDYGNLLVTEKGLLKKVKDSEKAVLLGSGTAEDPYQIRTVQHLINVKDDLSAHYTLMKDLDLESIESWAPLGNATTPFTGTFDGNGYKISNMKITSEGDLESYIGLFGYINEATIENLVLENYEISGTTGSYVGGLVGYSGNSTITNIRATGDITLTGTSSYIGGLIGYATGRNKTISICYTEGSIEASAGTYIGGLVGELVYSGIVNSYTSMNVTGSSNVGGLVGDCSDGGINYSYAMGKVTGSSSVGGLVGRVRGTGNTVASSYWLKELTGTITSAAGINKTVSAMIKQATYDTGWKFDTIWAMEEGTSLPYLQGMEVPSIVYDVVKETTILQGEGTEENPYLITSIKELQSVINEPTAYYKLMNDIDLSTVEKWTPIGTSSDQFTGNFNGNGYKISNMKITSEGDLGSYIGLFGYINEATIENLVLENYEISGTTGNYVGGLVGYAYDYSTKIENIRAIGKITITGSSTSSYVGGLVGYSYYCQTISKNYTQGELQVNNGYMIGGLVGELVYSGIVNSYTSMSVTGSDRVGGLVGDCSDGGINYSYAIGKVTGSSSVGGLVGRVRGTGNSSTSSYYDIETTGQTESALGTGLTTEQAKDSANYTGWAETGAWNLVEGEYPILK